jgi:hypothetical protein
MATTIDYLNQVYGDLLDAAKREGAQPDDVHPPAGCLRLAS